MSSPLYFSVQEFCDEENLDKDKLKAIAVDLGRYKYREIAERHGIGKSTVQRYKNKLDELDQENYIAVMNLVYQEELNRALLQKGKDQ